MERLRIRNILLVCTLFLGLQFCFPVALHAGDMTQVAEMISLGTKDPESKSTVLVDIDLTAPFILALVVRQPLATASGFHPEEDRECLSLLPVTGLHPSAP